MCTKAIVTFEFVHADFKLSEVVKYKKMSIKMKKLKLLDFDVKLDHKTYYFVKSVSIFNINYLQFIFFQMK